MKYFINIPELEETDVLLEITEKAADDLKSQMWNSAVYEHCGDTFTTMSKVIPNMDEGETNGPWEKIDAAINAWNEQEANGGYEREEIPTYVIQRLNDGIRNQLILQCIGHRQSVDEPINKQFWLELAETVGPDWAQTFYHGTVFMTKVA